MKACNTLLFVFVFSFGTAQDKLTLIDGQIVEGKVVRAGTSSVIFIADGLEREIENSFVQHITTSTGKIVNVTIPQNLGLKRDKDLVVLANEDGILERAQAFFRDAEVLSLRYTIADRGIVNVVDARKYASTTSKSVATMPSAQVRASFERPRYDAYALNAFLAIVETRMILEDLQELKITYFFNVPSKEQIVKFISNRSFHSLESTAYDWQKFSIKPFPCFSLNFQNDICLYTEEGKKPSSLNYQVGEDGTIEFWAGPKKKNVTTYRVVDITEKTMRYSKVKESEYEHDIITRNVALSGQ